VGTATAGIATTVQLCAITDAVADRVEWLHAPVLQQPHATAIIEPAVWDGPGHGLAVWRPINYAVVAAAALVASPVQASGCPRRL
jgi:hypothetical protein